MAIDLVQYIHWIILIRELIRSYGILVITFIEK